MSARWADVTHNVLALRAAPESGSEQISQAIMGDAVQILEEAGEYARVRGRDEYEGWALSSQLRLCEEAEGFLRRYGSTSEVTNVIEAFADIFSAEREQVTRIVFGTPLKVPNNVPAGAGFVKAQLPNGVECQVSALRLWPLHITERTNFLDSVARRFVGTPYLWGGTTPFGFDCSGLVQRVYSSAGITLPRDAYQQAVSPLGETVPEGEPLRPGDLVFFLGARDPHNRGITHVGMMIDATRMIHAHGRTGVTIEPLNGETIRSGYTYRGARRVKLQDG